LKRYAIEISPRARRDFKKLNPNSRTLIAARIDELAANPRPVGVEKLSGTVDAYRVREGDYRIVYQIKDRVLVVLIVHIGHRRDVYRKM
jgi:mRNA interferase RelE/StbE